MGRKVVRKRSHRYIFSRTLACKVNTLSVSFL